jgi:hypothetical protein
MNARLLFPVLAILAIGCTPKRIPGTDIEDTQDTKEIIDVMRTYANAVQNKDHNAILLLLSKDFRDDAGTLDPSDDLDHRAVGTTIADRMKRLEEVSVELEVKRIHVTDKNAAQAVYYYSTRFRMPSLTSRPQSESDIKLMTFAREDGKWKITSGI